MDAKKNVFVKKKTFKHKKLALILTSLIIIGGLLSAVYIPTVNENVRSIWQGILTLLTGFVLVNGKFVLKVFAKKMFYLALIGLSKRFFVEKIFMANFINLFIKKLPIKKYLLHTKESFFNFSIIKRVTAIVSIVLSAVGGAVAFGDIMLLKVVLAKFWSFMLVLFGKFMLLVGYLLLDSGWIRVVLEVVVFGFLMNLLEKVPFVHRLVLRIYKVFESSIKWVANVLEGTFNLPAQRAISKLTVVTSNWMHTQMQTEGYDSYHHFILRDREDKMSVYKQLNYYRVTIKPSGYKRVTKSRKVYTRPGTHVSGFKKLNNKQKINFDVTKKCLHLHKEMAV